MFEIEFYEDSHGISELWNFLDDLQKKAIKSKDARIQHEQISFYIELLQQNGTRLGKNITRHIIEDIWELRPGNNRVFYFYFGENTFVLLQQFHKNLRKPRHVRLRKPSLSGMTGKHVMERGEQHGDME